MNQRSRAAYLKHRHSIRQFIKFALVGGSGVLVNAVVMVVMHKLHGGTSRAGEVLFPIPVVGKNFRFHHLVWLTSFFFANLWNFQLNRSWTFRTSKHSSWWSEFVPFLTVGSIAAFAGLFIISALTHPNSMFYLPDALFTEAVGLRSRIYWAQIITIGLTTPINFLVNKLWTFRAVRAVRAGAADEESLPMLAPVVAPESVDDEGHLAP